MAEHLLFHGGAATRSNPGYAMFPSPAFDVDELSVSAAHKLPCLFSVTRVFDFKDEAALTHYIKNVSNLAALDNVEAVIVPRQTLLTGVWWKVERPLAGFSFSIDIRDDTTVVVASVDGSVVDSDFVPLDTPIYFKQNDVIRVNILTAPAPIPDNPLGAWGDLRFKVSPVLQEFERGQY